MTADGIKSEAKVTAALPALTDAARDYVVSLAVAEAESGTHISEVYAEVKREAAIWKAIASGERGDVSRDDIDTADTAIGSSGDVSPESHLPHSRAYQALEQILKEDTKCGITPDDLRHFRRNEEHRPEIVQLISDALSAACDRLSHLENHHGITAGEYDSWQAQVPARDAATKEGLQRIAKERAEKAKPTKPVVRFRD